MLKTRTLLYLLIVSLIGSSKLFGQQGVSQVISDEDRIVGTDDEIHYVTITKVSNHQGTRSNPPTLVARVDESLRVDSFPETKLNKLKGDWEYRYTGERYGFFPPPTEDERAEIQKMMQTPVKNPKVGSQWILIGFRPYEKSPKRFVIGAKFPLTKDRRVWVQEQLALKERYASERAMYKDRWAAPLNLQVSLKGERPVNKHTKLEPGTPVIAVDQFGGKWQCCVIELFADATVRVRPQWRDSRNDLIVTRDKIFLYPPEILKDTKASW